jgi:hypothetical protein
MANINNNTDESWKQKAIQRQIQNKDIRKRLKESKLSRDQWKLKAFQHKETIKKLENEINRIKKNLVKIITQK